MRYRIAAALFAIAIAAGLLPQQAAAIDGTETISTVAGTGEPGQTGDGGPATDAQLYNPAHMALDSGGNLYVATENNSRVRRIDAATGVITTYVGTGTGMTEGDGGPATEAGIPTAFGLAFDSEDNLYISQPGASRVRRVDASTGIITTYAGTGESGTTGDGGAATEAQVRSPHGLAVDSEDNLYIGSSAGRSVRRVDAATGIITTVAGTGASGTSGDGGPATEATFRSTKGVALDAADNLYVADDSAHVVRRVDATTGTITRIAGDGFIGYTGDGGPATDARLSQPMDVEVGPGGDVYIAASSNYAIRKVDGSSGIITTVMGDGDFGRDGDGGPANEAQLTVVQGVAVSPSGRVFASMNGPDDHRVRSAAPPATTPGGPRDVTAEAGDGQAVVSWNAPASDGGSPITGYTVTATPGGAQCTTATTSCVVEGLSNGTTYFFTVTAANAIGEGAGSDMSEQVTPNPPTAPTGPGGGDPANGCPTAPVLVDDSNRDGAAIAMWVCRMHLVGGQWQGETAVVLLPKGWFGCPDPAQRRWYSPGYEFGGWLLENHCGYEPRIVRTWFGPWFAWDPPPANAFWSALWAGTRA